MNPCRHSSQIESVPIVFKCTQKNARCGYHKKDQEFKFSNLTPDGMCPEAYHNLYYISLGILFNAEFEKKQLVIKCPATENYVVFKAGFERLNLRFRFLNVVKRFLYKMYIGQIYPGRLFWEIIKVKGECPRGHEIGTRFYINKGNFQITPNLLFPLGEAYELCPAVFDNLFPYLYSLKREKHFPYSDNSTDFIQCPDHKANITLEIGEYSE
jgi:uncharacterized repeat protein (TIGR04076 family)